MHLNVKERADHVATFRWIDVRLMEMLAAWVPTTPEMEVKLVFGAHIWDFAQHADAFGKRTHELRLPLQHSVEPSRDYVLFLDEVGATVETGKRIAGFYDCLLPGLQQLFGGYVKRVDPLLDGPTVRIIERVTVDFTRILNESKALREEVSAVRLEDQAWLERLNQQSSILIGSAVRRASDQAVNAA